MLIARNEQNRGELLLDLQLFLPSLSSHPVTQTNSLNILRGRTCEITCNQAAAGEVSRKPANGETEPNAENGMSRQGHDHKSCCYRYVEDLRIWRQQHAEFKGNGHGNCPRPVASRRIAYHGD